VSKIEKQEKEKMNENKHSKRENNPLQQQGHSSSQREEYNSHLAHSARPLCLSLLLILIITIGLPLTLAFFNLHQQMFTGKSNEKFDSITSQVVYSQTRLDGFVSELLARARMRVHTVCKTSQPSANEPQYPICHFQFSCFQRFDYDYPKRVVYECTLDAVYQSAEQPHSSVEHLDGARAGPHAQAEGRDARLGEWRHGAVDHTHDARAPGTWRGRREAAALLHLFCIWIVLFWLFLLAVCCLLC
jgi:hypothetical protein